MKPTVEQKMKDLATLGKAIARDCELLWQGSAVTGITEGFEPADFSEFAGIEDDLTRSHQSITAFLSIEAWLVGTELPDWSIGKVDPTASSTEAQSALTSARIAELPQSHRAVSHRSTSHRSETVLADSVFELPAIDLRDASDLSGESAIAEPYRNSRPTNQAAEEIATSEAILNPTVSDVSQKQNFLEVATAIDPRLLTSQTSSIETRTLASTQLLTTQTSAAQTAIEKHRAPPQSGLQAFAEAIAKTEKSPNNQSAEEDLSPSQSLNLSTDSLLENDTTLAGQQTKNQPIGGLSALAQTIEEQQTAAHQIVDSQPTVQENRALSKSDHTHSQPAAPLPDKIESFNGLPTQPLQQQSSANDFPPITSSSSHSTQSELVVKPASRLAFPSVTTSNGQAAAISTNVEEITAAIADPLYEKLTAEVVHEYRRFYGDG